MEDERQLPRSLSWIVRRAADQVYSLLPLDKQPWFTSNAANLREPELQESRIPKWECFFLVINLVAEIAAVVVEAYSSVHKHKYALVAMLTSIVITIICISEQVVKAKKGRFIWKWRGVLPWLYRPSQNHKPFGTKLEMIALSCSIMQTVASVIAYIFHRTDVHFNFGISFYPLFFAFGLSICKARQIWNQKVPSRREEEEEEEDGINELLEILSRTD